MRGLVHEADPWTYSRAGSPESTRPGTRGATAGIGRNDGGSNKPKRPDVTIIVGSRQALYYLRQMYTILDA
jgi:hypothetical protein